MQGRQRLVDPGFEVRILGTRRLLLELLDVLPVLFDHFLDVGAVEGLARRLSQAV